MTPSGLSLSLSFSPPPSVFLAFDARMADRPAADRELQRNDRILQNADSFQLVACVNTLRRSLGSSLDEIGAESKIADANH